jgi:hypothetical protein
MRWGRYIVIGAALLVALVVLTPPGQALLGDEPSLEHVPFEGELSEPVLIGSGTAPDGSRFEVTTYESNLGRCVKVTILETGQSHGSCAEPLDEGWISIAGAGSPKLSPEATYVLEGQINPEVSDVEMRYSVGSEEATTQVTVAEGYFVAFLPEGVDPGSIGAFAYDEGTQVGSVPVPPELIELLGKGGEGTGYSFSFSE